MDDTLQKQVLISLCVYLCVCAQSVLHLVTMLKPKMGLRARVKKNPKAYTKQRSFYFLLIIVQLQDLL